MILGGTAAVSYFIIPYSELGVIGEPEPTKRRAMRWRDCQSSMPFLTDINTRPFLPGYAIEFSLCTLTCCCYTKAACSDPGIVFKELYDLHALDEEFADAEGGKVPRNRCMHCDG